MPRNASGVFSLSGTFAIPNAVPSSSTINSYIGDIGDEVTNSFDRDGKAVMRAHAKFGGYKITGLGDGTVATDAATYGQVSAAGSMTGNNVWTGTNIFQMADDGATIGPDVVLQRNSTSPAINDVIGGITFKGRDSVPATLPAIDYTTYAGIEARILNPVEAVQDGLLAIRTTSVNVDATRLIIGKGVYTALATGGDKGPDTINAGAYYVNGNLGTMFPRGWIDGLILSNNATDLLNDIDFTAGQCTSDDGTYIMNLSAITKRLDANWLVGTNQGGLDTGSEANSTWYHVFAIARPDTGVCDIMFSASLASPTMPASYTKKRRIGSVFNDSSGNIRAFFQNGDNFWWSTIPVDVDATNPGAAAVTRTLSVPTGIKVIAIVSIGCGFNSAASGGITVSSLDGVDQALQNSPGAITGVWTWHGYSAAGGFGGGQAEVQTDTSGQIRTRCAFNSASDHLGILTRGWCDPRGRNT